MSFVLVGPGAPWIRKKPAAVLDYALDRSSWLPEGDTLIQATWTVPVGLTKTMESMTDTLSAVWIGGGVAGTRYKISCEVTTNEGRKESKAFTVVCSED